MAIPPRSDSPAHPPGSALIDHIYRLLSGIDEDLVELKRDYGRSAKVDVFQGGAILDAVQLLTDYGYGGRLGLPGTELAKLNALKGARQR